MFDIAHSSETPDDLLVERLRTAARRVAEAQARYYASVLAVAQAASDGPMIDEFAADEVRAAMTLTRRAADMHVELASQLCERLPAVWEALHSGHLDLARARVIIDQTHHLEDTEACAVVDQVLGDANEWTTGQLRVRIRRLIIEIDPQAETERYKLGIEDRSVTLDANPDGTANLCAWNLPGDRAAAAMKHLSRQARAAKTHDGRTVDQIRADVLIDTLTGRAVESTTGGSTVDIQVDLTTLMQLSERAGEIPGWGPIVADVARRVVADQTQSRWDVSVIDPDTAHRSGPGQPGDDPRRSRPEMSEPATLIASSRGAACPRSAATSITPRPTPTVA